MPSDLGRWQSQAFHTFCPFLLWLLWTTRKRQDGADTWPWCFICYFDVYNGTATAATITPTILSTSCDGAPAATRRLLQSIVGVATLPGHGGEILQSNADVGGAVWLVGAPIGAPSEAFYYPYHPNFTGRKTGDNNTVCRNNHKHIKIIIRPIWIFIIAQQSSYLVAPFIFYCSWREYCLYAETIHLHESIRTHSIKINTISWSM